MTQFDQEWLEFMRDLFPKGTQIQCTELRDGVPVLSGGTGSLEHIDDMGLFHCDLDDGRRLIAAIDEGCFQVIVPEQPEFPRSEKHRQLMDRNRNLPDCSEHHRDQRMEVLSLLELEKTPKWAVDVLFPPIRSVFALPGKAAEVIEVGGAGASIREQLHAEHLVSDGVCSSAYSVNIYCDRDAKKKGLPFNRKLDGFDYYGPILINGMHAEDRALTDAETKELLQRLNCPEAMREAPKQETGRREKNDKPGQISYRQKRNRGEHRER